jgi:hypothetical protein
VNLTSSHARTRVAADRAARLNMPVEVAEGRIRWDESIGSTGGFRHFDKGRALTVPELCALWQMRQDGHIVVDGTRVALSSHTPNLDLPGATS